LTERNIPEEPRQPTGAQFSPLRTLWPLLRGLGVVVLVVAALIVLGSLFKGKSATREEKARSQQIAKDPTLAEHLRAGLKTYPPLSEAEQQRLKDTIAVVETDFGRFAFELLPELAPQTVQNFVWLAEQRFYDEQLVAGGEAMKGITLDGLSEDPEFNYRVRAEFSNLEVGPGTVVLTRTIDPGFAEGAPEKSEYLNSGSTRIWISLAPKPEWTPKFSIFGKVIEGMDVVEELSRAFSKAFSQGPYQYVSEVLVYRVRLVPRGQLQAVLAEPLREPTQVPWAPQRSVLPPA